MLLYFLFFHFILSNWIARIFRIVVFPDCFLWIFPLCLTFRLFFCTQISEVFPAYSYAWYSRARGVESVMLYQLLQRDGNFAYFSGNWIWPDFSWCKYTELKWFVKINMFSLGFVTYFDFIYFDFYACYVASKGLLYQYVFFFR